MKIKAIFQPFSYSCKTSFLEAYEENAYKALKELVNKIIKNLIAWANRCGAVLSIWFETVAYNGKGELCPHVHGVLYADRGTARDKLNELWQKNDIGYTGWRCPGKGGKPPSNAWWGRFENYPKGLYGWIGGGYWDKAKKRPNVGYLNSKANKYSSKLRQRSSSVFNGAKKRSSRLNLSIYDIWSIYQQGEAKFCTLTNAFKR